MEFIKSLYGCDCKGLNNSCYSLCHLIENFKNWNRKNEKVSKLIQEMQLVKINQPDDIVFKRIPYSQFCNIKEIYKNNFTTVYSAIWKDDDPLHCERNSNKTVSLKYLCNSQNMIIDHFFIKINFEYTIKSYSSLKIYGISQNPDTKDYIIILNSKYYEENYVNWTSGNNNIDGFIQEMQLKINHPTDIIFEWIPYHQFSSIKEISKDNSAAVYLATWRDGPLFYYSKNFKNWNRKNEKVSKLIQEMQLVKINQPDDIVFKRIPYSQFCNIKEIYKNNFTTVYSAIWKDDDPLHCERNSNKTVSLKYLCNSQNMIIDHFFIKINFEYTIKSYSSLKIYGISQNPDTKDYIIILNSKYYEENYVNWTSGNNNIDGFIQEMQLKINHPTDIIFEWIPYHQFSSIKEISKDNSAAVYLATWRDGPLFYYSSKNKHTRIFNERVTLKCIYNSQIMVNDFLVKVKNYVNYYSKRIKIYGISQNDEKDYIIIINGEYCEEYCLKCDERYTNIEYKWCRPCEINCLRDNFINWTSKSEKIDNFIQKMQLKINHPIDIIFEWIPYHQFSSIKEISKDNSAAVYLATWKDGPLFYSSSKNKYTKNFNERVTLKCIYNSQIMMDDFLDKVKNYDIYYNECIKIYGISQNLDTKDYIIILNSKYYEEYCLKCDKRYTNIEYKWCRSCEINFLKEKFVSWTSGNKNIDRFIQEMQLKIDHPTDIIFEWIPYHQFSSIEEIGKDNSAAVYLATWKDGPLFYSSSKNKYTRSFNERVTLKCIYNSQIMMDDFLDKVKNYDIYYNERIKIYGISQNPYTKDYIIIINGKYCEEYCLKCDETYTNIEYKWCRPCEINCLIEKFVSWTSGNKNIDRFIQEMQLKIDHPTDIIFEWIPYHQLSSIKEISKDNSAAVCLATWKDGPLFYSSSKNKYTKNFNERVILKCIYNSQIMMDDFLDKVKNYDIYYNECIKIYGISQNLDTKDYIIILNSKYYEEYCLKCDKRYTNIEYKWCRSCEINFLKEKFVSWTSGNKNIDRFIQEMQLKIDHPTDIIFEWIPYHQFSSIEEIGKDNSAAVYLATWKDGPLFYSSSKNKYTKNFNERVTLKCIYNSQIMMDDFLDKVKNYNIYYNERIKKYGISQNPYTKDYIIIINGKYCEEYCLKCDETYTNIEYKWCRPCEINCLREKFISWTSGNKNIDRFIQEMQLKINHPTDIIFEWIPYHQFSSIKEISKDNSAAVYLATWKDGPLFYSSSKNKYTKNFNERVT
ncbi:unnamed protein product [Rhizophagus irregularis]|nr:unnamed protein product [Rhizophagus irregularis]